MTQPLPSPGIALYVWPGQWSLPSFDPLSLAAVLYLQLAIPGKFSLVECNNPDLSPTGQLPFLVHEQQCIAPFSAIVKYVSNLSNTDRTSYPDANLDESLSIAEKSQKIAWCAHVESHLGDLIYHMLYSSQQNWEGLTHPMLVSLFPVPQRYYVPERIRSSYRPRLDAAGLWNLPVPEKEKKMPFKVSAKSKEDDKKSIFLQAFEKEKVLEKASSVLDMYIRLLGDTKYIFDNRPTTLDVLLSAHVLLLLNPPYPEPLLKDLISERYPSLASHAHRVHTRTFHESFTPIATTSQHSSLRALIPPWNVWKRNRQREKTAEDLHYDRMNLGFFGLALGSFCAYLFIVGKPFVQTILQRQRMRKVRDVVVDDSDESQGDD